MFNKIELSDDEEKLDKVIGNNNNADAIAGITQLCLLWEANKKMPHTSCFLVAFLDIELRPFFVLFQRKQ